MEGSELGLQGCKVSGSRRGLNNEKKVFGAPLTGSLKGSTPFFRAASGDGPFLSPRQVAMQVVVEAPILWAFGV